MIMSPADAFVRVVETCGELWILDGPWARAEAVSVMLGRIERSVQWWQRESAVASQIPEPSVEGLKELADEDDIKCAAFLQGLRRASTPQMVAMVWHLCHGGRIENLSVDYTRVEQFELVVMVSTPNLTAIQNYKSSEIYDIALISHFAPAKINDRPYLLGFQNLKHS